MSGQMNVPPLNTLGAGMNIGMSDAAPDPPTPDNTFDRTDITFDSNTITWDAT